MTAPAAPPEPWCPGCQRLAADCPEYDDPRQGTGYSRAEYVRREDGTYNPLNGHFLCDRCYIAAGMPTAPGGWRCP